MKFANGREALQQWLKYLQYIFPSIVMLIALVGCIIVVFVDGADSLGWTVMAIGGLVGVVLYVIFRLLSLRLDKIIARENQAKELSMQNKY